MKTPTLGNLKGKLKMSDKGLAAMGTIIPRWMTTILMAVTVFFLARLVRHVDAVSSRVVDNSRTISVMSEQSKATTEGLAKAVESIEKIDGIARILEQRLVRLETKEESRRQ